MSEDDYDESYEIDEYPTSFDYEHCICDHPADEHGWSGCREEGCPCEASWEE